MILLQTQELDPILRDLTKSSLELAEATANLGALKIVFGVFLVFMILIIITFLYQMFTLNSKIATIHQVSQETRGFFSGAADRSIGTTQAEIIIRRSFNSLGQSLKYNILRIRIENNIDHKEQIIAKVVSIVQNEFSELESLYSNFTYGNKTLSEILNTNDASLVKEFMVEQIYVPKESFTISAMDQTVNLMLNGLKLSYIRNL